MVFIVMRHGESEWNKENKYTGWVDVSLSEKGQQEALEVGKNLNNYSFNNIITSDLKRTIQTAELIVKYKTDLEKNNIIITHSELVKERNYGDLAGINKLELEKKYGTEQMNIWRRSYFGRPPNGENLEDVCIRVGKYYDEFILPLLKENKNVLLVSHGNALRALFVYLGIKNTKTIETFELSTATPICIDINNCDYSYINDYKLIGTQIIDSRGYPTIQVSCLDNKTNKIIGKGSCPSGASCGSSEVLELRDNDNNLYNGKSVFKAIENIQLVNKYVSLNKNTITNLKNIDKQLNLLDNTKLKSILGGNTTTAVSFCIADVASKINNIEMFKYIKNEFNFIKDINIPTPFVNIINGGKHGVTDELKIQEFMIFSNEKYSIKKQIQIICEVYQKLKKILVEKYGKEAKSIGDEGGFCPPIYSTNEALNVIEEAIIKANYIVGKDVFLALDCAASEFYDKTTKLYNVEKNKYLTNDELIIYYENLIKIHPAIKSIEDGFDEQDYDAWIKFNNKLGDKIMIVGDDLFTTNSALIKKGLIENWANTLLLKVNQIGTISEAIESAKLMFNKNNNVIVSHRSGETNHAYIIDIAVGIGANYVKIGSPCRGERVAKFNRLIEIDELLRNYT